MPYVDNDGVQIFYEVFGEGKPLILQHGLMGSLESWTDAGYIEALSESFKVIFVHARGHGKSDKPHTAEAYNVSKMADDIVAVMDDLELVKVPFLGYSMGGRIGLGMGMYHPGRLSSLIIGGMGAEERDDPNTVSLHESYIKVLRQGYEVLFKALEERDGEVSEKERTNWLNADLDAVIAYYGNVENVGFLENLPDVQVPTLVYAGEEDSYYTSAKLCAEIMPDARFVGFSGLDHGSCFDRSDLILPHVLRFLAEQDTE